MSKKVDLAQLKLDTDIVQVIGSYVDLKQKGSRWNGVCPFHDEKSPSFYVYPSKRSFECFGCKKFGDVFDFFKFMGKDLSAAIEILHDPNNTAAFVPGEKEMAKKKKKTKNPWVQIIPGIKVENMFNHPDYGMPNRKWEFLGPSGELLGYTCRFDLPEKKEVLPYIFGDNGFSMGWVYAGFKNPRPLYRLDQIASRPKAPVLLVEGEKTADAAQLLFPKAIVSTWIGGAGNAALTDFSVLKERRVFLWPDNDKAGFDAMHYIHAKIKDIVEEVHWVHPPEGSPKGWDVADANWTPEEAKAYIAENALEYPGENWKYQSVEDKEAAAQEETDRLEKETSEAVIGNALQQSYDNLVADTAVIHELEVVHSAKKIKKTKKASLKNPPQVKVPTPPNEDDPEGFTLKGTEYFKMLGTKKEGNGMIFYFYSYKTKTVLGFTPAGMTKSNLMQLAPLNWLKNTFPDDKYNISVDKAANYLIHMCSLVGTYNEKWCRGRGAWVDGKDVVIHAGDKLFVNGKETDLHDYKSRYIYEIGEPLGFNMDKPIDVKQSAGLIELLNMMKWERKVNALLFAGWCVVAPVCGVLEWRPHIWLTGAAGTGKSRAFNFMLKDLLGETAVSLQGETTEAGLRQVLQQDALPVVFDEAEGEDRKSQDRMQSVLANMRAASTNNGGKLAKGTSGGNAKMYESRSCYAFASIAPQATLHADRSRISTLGLVKNTAPDRKETWKVFLKKYADLLTPQYCSGFRARTISMLPSLLENIKMFSNAAGTVLGEQRSGDQIGVLMAGAWSLQSDKVATYDEAVKFISEADDWEEEISLKESSDELSLISHILEQPLRIETQSATVERTIGELVLISLLLRLGEWNINDKQANERLKRVGIKVRDEAILISNSDVNLVKMLAGTPWAKNHSKILRRLEGATVITCERFATAVATRAVMIPKDTLFNGVKPETALPPPEDPITEVSKKVVDVYTQAKIDTQTEGDLPF
jgi:putative DNA primase/helicase